MDLYADTILEHYRHPQGKEPLAAPTVRHEERNVACGDSLTVDLLIDDGAVTALGWTGEGCAISQAGMSMLFEELRGKTTAAIDALTPAAVQAMLGVPIGPRRIKCALLALHALKNALRIHRGEPPQPWQDTLRAA